jgi:hypothetical protein
MTEGNGVKHRKKEDPMDSTTEALVERMRERSAMALTVQQIDRALALLEEATTCEAVDEVTRLLTVLRDANQYWVDAQRKAFEEYLEVKKAGWPDEFPSSSAPEGA